MADSTSEDLIRLEGRVEKHEAVCAERWGTINSRVSRIEALGWSTLTSMIGGLGFVAWYFFTHSVHP